MMKPNSVKKVPITSNIPKTLAKPLNSVANKV